RTVQVPVEQLTSPALSTTVPNPCGTVCDSTEIDSTAKAEPDSSADALRPPASVTVNRPVCAPIRRGLKLTSTSYVPAAGSGEQRSDAMLKSGSPVVLMAAMAIGWSFGLVTVKVCVKRGCAMMCTLGMLRAGLSPGARSAGPGGGAVTTIGVEAAALCPPGNVARTLSWYVRGAAQRCVASGPVAT